MIQKIFDVVKTPIDEPLLIEASAGTGKTYSLMHLILRLLIEKKIPIQKILVVTFTKNAVGEVRNRLRADLQYIYDIFKDSDTVFEQVELIQDPTLKNQILKWIDKESFIVESELKERLTEIETIVRNAILNIDDASIFTIHGFCNRLITECTFSSKGRFGLFIGDTEGLKVQAIDSVVRRIFKDISNHALAKDFLSYDNFSGMLQQAGSVSRRIPILQALQFEEGSLQPYMNQFLETAPEEYRKLKLKNKTLCYDDLLVEVDSMLGQPDFITSVRDKYDAVLIDEFQDTDPLQYAIFRDIFLKDAGSQKTVIFVGDPKQSIYAFRNADLQTYLNARNSISNQLYLEKNFRSTPGIVSAINCYFSLASNKEKSSFLNPGLIFTPVKFNDSKLPLFQKAEDSFVPLPSFEIITSVTELQKEESAGALRETEAYLVAEKIAYLLTNEIYLGNPLRRLKPSDIAILVRKRSDADSLMRELKSRNIRYIIQSNESIFSTEEAKEIRNVLKAMENPKSQSLMAKARTTKIFGHTLQQIEESEKHSLIARELIEQANKKAMTSGVLSSFTWLFKQLSVEERLLKERKGQTSLTNYRHLMELLHEENRKIKTVSGLIRWLDKQQDTSSEENSVRLESDSDLIRIETIHKSKGLEYPVVMILQAAASNKNETRIAEVIVDGLKQKVLLSKKTSAAQLKFDNKLTFNNMQEERVRQLYVAMTRASSLLVLPLLAKCNAKEKKDPATGKLFPVIHASYLKSAPFQALSGDAVPDNLIVQKALQEGLPLAFEKEKPAIVEALKKGASGLKASVFIPEDYVSAQIITVTQSDIEASMKKDRKNIPSEIEVKLEVGKAFKHPYPEWIRTSFSALARGIEIIPEESPAFDESPVENETQESIATEISEDFLRFKPLQLSAASYGDFLHHMLEELDFSLADPVSGNRDKLETFVRNKLILNAIEPDNEQNRDHLEEHTKAITNMLTETLLVKGIRGLPDFSLSSLHPENRMSEMGFMLSNQIKEEGKKSITASQLGKVLQRLDPQYIGLNLDNEVLRGYLVGSIDLLFKENGKFWLIDWKSNFLTDNPSDYTSETLEEAMNKKHYKLQYLIYSIALKRYLESRFRKKDVYDLFGGVSYFFLRGVRASNPHQGIYFDKPKKAVLECVDTLLKSGYDEAIVEKFIAQAKGEGR